MRKRLKNLGVALALLVSLGGVVYAVDTEFSQVINDGVLSVSILDENEATVASPSVAFGAITAATSCQTPGTSGILGTNTQRIYVDNPSAADAGWNLSIAATGGTTSTWSNGADLLDFNDASGTPAGCGDGADADSAAGQLSVDSSVGTLTADCASCDNIGITEGSAASFAEGTVNSINLLAAAAGSDDIYRGYLTGVDLDQTIPAEQPTGTYTLDMAITVVAN